MPKVLYPDGKFQPLCKLLPTPMNLFGRRFLKFMKKHIEKENKTFGKLNNNNPIETRNFCDNFIFPIFSSPLIFCPAHCNQKKYAYS